MDTVLFCVGLLCVVVGGAMMVGFAAMAVARPVVNAQRRPMDSPVEQNALQLLLAIPLLLMIAAKVGVDSKWLDGLPGKLLGGIWTVTFYAFVLAELGIGAWRLVTAVREERTTPLGAVLFSGCVLVLAGVAILVIR